MAQKKTFFLKALGSTPEPGSGTSKGGTVCPTFFSVMAGQKLPRAFFSLGRMGETKHKKPHGSSLDEKVMPFQMF